MRAAVKVWALILLAAVLTNSCNTRQEITFEAVYKDMLNVVDHPERMDESVLAETGLHKLWDKAAVIDSMPKRTVVYGSGLCVKQSGSDGFTYIKDSPHAFALRIESFMDPEVSVDFANKEDADKFYGEITDFGMVEDDFGCRYVTDKRLSPGEAKVKDFAEYGRTICVQKPSKTDNGWYSVVFGN